MNITSDSILTSLCWTLLHSLWQAALIALIAGLLMQVLKNTKASVKYNLLTSALVLFLLVTAYTFYSYLKIDISDDFAIVSRYDLSTTKAIGITPAMASSFDIHSFINANANLFVGLWFVFFVLKFIVLSRQALYASRLQRIGLETLPDVWQQKTSKLASALALDHKYTVALSSYVATPMVIGLIKPTLLLPMTILNGMPQDQIEAILLHELAHIKRNDYFFNVLQRIVELAFFFNPGLMWLSAAIDDEREHACDELALSIHHDRHSFVNALLGCNTFMAEHNKLALGFGSNKKYLLNRAKRILTNEYNGLAKYDKTMMVLCLLITSLPVIHHFTQDKATVVEQSTSMPTFISTDTIPSSSDSVKMLSEIKQLQSETAALSRTGVKLDKLQTNKLLLLQERLVVLQDRLNLLNEAKLYENNAYNHDSTMTNLAIAESKLQALSMKLDAEALALQAEAVKLDAEAKHMAEAEQNLQENAKILAADELRMAEDHARMQRDHERMQQDHQKMQQDQLRMEADARRMEADAAKLNAETGSIERRTKAIVEQMMKDKIITSQKNLSFSLGENELIVNYKKQSAEMAKKYFKLFGFKGGRILHNFDTDTEKK